MEKEEFKSFVDKTLIDVIEFAEAELGKTLPKRIALRWLSDPDRIIKDNVVNAITEKIYINPQKIYPYVSIGASEIMHDTTVILASVARHNPRPFGRNIKGKMGPFDITVHQTLKNNR